MGWGLADSLSLLPRFAGCEFLFVLERHSRSWSLP